MDAIRLLSKTVRRKIGSTYQSAIPLRIADLSVSLPQPMTKHIQELVANIARFDAEQRARGYDLPALLLRSESSSSSQIEHLTSSARNVALAELSDDAPKNAQLIAGNIAAMNHALETPDDINVDTICTIHRSLMAREGATFGGTLRSEPVWIGGTAFSPHGASFVPPRPELVPELLDDLTQYARREDIDAVVKASIVHAQFETVHPFIDGNGRTGRTLLHKVLRSEGVLTHTVLPVSAGLLHNVDAYMASLDAYHQGDPLAVVEQVVDALDVAVTIGNIVAREIDDVLERWAATIRDRAGSSIHHLPSVLVTHPVVNGPLVARELGITPRAARDAIERACSYGMLRPIGNRRRGVFYQCDAIVEVLDLVSSREGIRRLSL